MTTSDSNREPVALIGRSLRFPGACSPAELLDLLGCPRDIVGDFPPLRVNMDGYYHADGNVHGATNVRQSYFIDEDHRVFDAAFFSISPVEAEAMDPQQRILLELVYEAMESAGLTIDQLRGSRTSVFVGVMSSDFSTIQQRDIDTASGYAVTGTAISILSNRISYFYDWKGPCMTIDTACSSSLVAVHQAVQSLRSGESDLAVVAGANLILNPEPYITESKLHMLSPSSRCRMWDAQADGYARGDGFAVVMLKTLKQAVKDGDHILSVIRETAVNMDGRTAGLTTPNPSAQAALIRTTYERAGLDCRLRKDRCQYFEAHGTGTPTGDPIEAEAVQSAFFGPQEAGVDGEPCHDRLYVGSVKTVVGHLEGCAGLAGLLKASLAVERGMIFPNLHFDTLNPSIEPFYHNVEVATSAKPWPAMTEPGPRRASVNSFGFGGTNAHAIIESYEETSVNGPRQNGVSSAIIAGGPFLFSCHSQHSLLALIRQFVDYLQRDATANLESLAWTLRSCRTIFPVRAAFSSSTREGLLEALQGYVGEYKDASTGIMEKNNNNTTLHRRSPAVAPPKIVGVFTGQGAQWPRMGRELLVASPLYSQVIDKLQESLDALPDPPCWSLREQLMAESTSSRVMEAAVGQPLCTALQIALVDVLRSAGISFAVVVGHSSGEITAAYASGFLSASDAIRVAYYRGYYASSAGGGHRGRKGAMMAVDMSFRDGLEFCESGQFAGRITVAASNSATSVTLSGDADAVHEAQELLEKEGAHSARLLHVDMAYHSHHMNKAVEPYIRALRACKIRVLPGQADCAWMSSVTLHRVTTKAQLGDLYWADNMTKPVLFSQAVERAVQTLGSADLIIEVGPHPALRSPATQTASNAVAAGQPIPYCSLLRRGHDDVESFSNALGYIWTVFGNHARIDFDGYQDAFRGRGDLTEDRPCGRMRSVLQGLPSYPWDHRQIHWRESRVSRNSRLGGHRIHPLLGRRRPDDAPNEMRWRNIIHLGELPWLRGHTFQGQVIFPAAGYVSMAFEAASAVSTQDGSSKVRMIEVRDMTVTRALVLTEESNGTEITFSLSRLRWDRRRQHLIVVADFVCSSCPNKADAELQVNVTGQVRIMLDGDGASSKEEEEEEEKVKPQAAVNNRSMLDMDIERFYHNLSKVGFDYSGLFRGLSALKRTSRVAVASASWRTSGMDMSLLVHPAVLDTGFQAIFASVSSVSPIRNPYLPTRIQSIRFQATSPSEEPETMTDASTNVKAYVTDICPQSKSVSTAIRADVDMDRPGCWTIKVEGLCLTALSAPDPSNDRPLFWRTAWLKDVSSVVDPPEGGKDSLDETQLPELLERLCHVHLRELYARTPREVVATFKWHHQRIFEFMEDMFSSVDSGEHSIIKKEWTDDTRQSLSRELAKFPNVIDLQAVSRVAESFPSVLAGERPMIEVLMEDDLLTRLYSQGLVIGRGSELISHMAKNICHRYPRLTWIEVGAGTGSTTSRILERIGGDALSSYTYTDISSGFFVKAKERFKRFAAKMDFKTLDIEADPADQRFAAHSYDVVVASNVLHATRHLETTMANVRKLLRPGGYLLLLEPTHCSVRVSFLMSGLPGWWQGGDDGRRLFPGLAPARWDVMLRETGFSGIDVLLQDSDDPTKHVCSAILSQAVDHRVAMLRQPLLTLESIATTQLLVIGGKTRRVRRLMDEIRQLLNPWNKTHVVEVDSFGSVDAQDAVTDGMTVLCLEELEQPVFESMTEQTFLSMRELLVRSRDFLWVTDGRNENPYADMILGVVRVLLNEAPHLNIQVLQDTTVVVDGDEFDSSGSARVLTEALLRLVVQREHVGTDVLWSNEPELVLLERDKLLIPRLLPDQELNDRLNCSWRSIQREMPAASSSPAEAVVVENSTLGSYHLRQGPSLHVPGHGGHVTIKTRLSLLHPVVITPELCTYICLGEMMETGKSVVAMSLSNASVVHTRQDWIYACEVGADKEEEFLQSITEGILSRSILRGLVPGDVLLLHRPEASMASRIVHMASDLGVRVVLTSSDVIESRTKPDCVYVDPSQSLRELRSMLPADIVKLVNFDNDEDEEEQALRQGERGKLRACMSPFSTELDMTTLLPDHVQFRTNSNREVDPDNSSLLRNCLDEAIQDCSQSPESHKATTIKANDLKDAVVDKRRSICIVDWRDQHVYTVEMRPPDFRGLFRSDKTYLLAGLTSDLGQSLGRWMILNGARHIILASRRGVVPSLWLQEMRDEGAEVEVLALDITDREALASALSEACTDTNMPPVAGVFNGAMVLSDMIFADMTFEAMSVALRPKVQGSKNLDHVFRDVPLDFFIMLSSLSAVAGFYGQANYAAANMFMAGLAAQRRRRGLAASVVAIGMLTEVGYVARAGHGLEEQLRDKFHCLPISEPEFHQMMAETVIASRPDAQHPPDIITGLQSFNSLIHRGSRPPGLNNPRFYHVVEDSGVANRQGKGVEGAGYSVTMTLLQRLANVSTAREAARLVLGDFIARLAAMLQTEESKVDGQVPLIDLGVDSLIAIEIRSWFVKELGVDVPSLKVLSGCTAAQLCNDVVEQHFSSPQVTTPPTPTPSESSALVKPDDASSQQQKRRAGLVDCAVMSYAQSRLWFLINYAEDPTHHTVVLSYNIRGPLNPSRFQTAFQTVIARHQTFRTCFFRDPETGKGMQGILQKPLVSLIKEKQVSNDAELAQEIENIQRQVFHPEKGELLSATLLHRAHSSSTFVLGYSHIIMDGSSLSLFLQDLNEAYQDPQTLHQRPSGDEYIDFSARQRRLVADGSLSKEMRFWTDQLSPLPEVLPLLGMARSRSRSSRGAYRVNTVDAAIPFSHVLKLRRLSQRLGVTPFHLHLTAIQWLLFKLLAGTDDICIGIADANRFDHRYRQTLGIFLNLLPLRLGRSRDNETFAEAVTGTSAKVLSALEHSRLPFEVMLEQLGVERSLAHTPLFQVFVNHRMGAFEHNPLGRDCELQHRSVSEAVFPYDLFITLTEPTRESCVITVTGRDDIYDDEACSLLVRTLVHLVGQLCEDPSKSMDNYTLYSESEARLSMDLGRAPRKTCRLDQTLPRLVDHLSQRVPTRVAVKDGYGNRLTYRLLAEKSAAMAGELSGAGVVRGSYVAVLMNPCAHMIPSILAILGLGAIYVPLDLLNPPGRLGAILADCRPAAILCQQNTVHLAEKLRTGDTAVVDVTMLPERSGGSVDDCSRLDFAAFALYTSGSQGRPKGVLLSQANMLQCVDGMLEGHDINYDQVVLQQSSMGFDLSLYQIIWAIVGGGTLVIVPQPLRRNPVELSKMMRDEGVTLTLATPSEYGLLLSQGNHEYLQRCSAWRIAASAGENMNSQVAQLFHKLALPNLVIPNWFGPTEAGIFSTTDGIPCQEMMTTSQSFSADEYPSIGRPVPNTSVYIVDDNLEPVPTGFPGEMCVSGPSVALGYVNEKVMDRGAFTTAVHFGSDADADADAERLYRTGDRGRIRADGTIIFLGRLDGDSQVKIRGFRIDLDDIAASIIHTAGDSLSDAAVLVRGDPEVLVAFVVFAPGNVPAKPAQYLQDLRLRLPLPDHMRPSTMVPVPQIPINTNGKRDSAALAALPLPRLDDLDGQGGKHEEAVLSPTESRLRDLWLESLPDTASSSRIGRETSFFHAGGSSILLMKLQALIVDAFNVNISLASLINLNTLRMMAGTIEARRRRRENDSVSGNTLATNGIGGPNVQEDVIQSSPQDDNLNDTRLTTFNWDAIDWEAETEFADNDMSVSTLDQEERKIRSTSITVLLTGATETLGRSLLEKLVQDDNVSKIHCVAVPLVGELDHYAKVQSHIGSLSMPNLGLDDEEMEMLSGEVDLILHASVDGSFLSSYQTVRSISLGAVRHLARIASQRRHRMIPIHFLSSSRVLLFSGAASLPEVSVARFLPPPDGSEGLAAARWACERYLQTIAGKLGLPVYIHRCCAVTTTNGATESDVLSSIWSYSRRIKAVPIFETVNGFIDSVPIEALVDKIVHTLFRAASMTVPSARNPGDDASVTGQVTFIHHTSGRKVLARHLAEYVEDQGEPVEEIVLTEWLHRARKLGLSAFAASFLDAVGRRPEPVFFPLMLKTVEI